MQRTSVRNGRGGASGFAFQLVACTMDGSRPSSPEGPPEDLWSSILDSVSSSRSIPSKQILLLGEPSCGKSTLVSALLQKPVDEKDAQKDFAIGYDWADVKDEAEEGTPPH